MNAELKYKKDFPIFSFWEEKGRPLVYLDSAATAQMPDVVVAAVKEFQESARANVHRGIYSLSEEATEKYEGARVSVARFLNARAPEEIVFTRNTTESINLLAYSLGKSFFKKGDRIILSRAEHHSNFLPWQMLRDEKGIMLDIVDPDENGEISLSSIEEALTKNTRLAAFSHVSHVFGTINQIEEMGTLFRKNNILFVVDGAQSIAHMSIDVQRINADFFAFSGHKIGAPMGIGVLYGRKEIFESLEPFMRGGGMIQEVFIEKSRWEDIPARFEAGTPNVEGAIGLAAALEYIEGVGYDAIQKIDRGLTTAIVDSLCQMPGVRVYGPKDPEKRGGVVSFSIDGIHPHDLATVLSRDGVSIRAGHHCAMPLMEFLGVPALARASVWVYNTPRDVKELVRGVENAIRILYPVTRKSRA
ncbi:MAG: hypothetical protein A2131_01460 [Candidatus Sungbacteria bacterium GWC2_49_10]|uniref:cysteine desulfurase n=1 Tax=Candidatus Sungbacteria bacterium GWC2_49_10 TaxID=1802263 RepID=A0A1G2K2V0_9BACT|nr:MAG: hypothetical protein A2131_01460 [Candidatus Sungbacteria bacterium GWC2_49_10]